MELQLARALCEGYLIDGRIANGKVSDLEAIEVGGGRLISMMGQSREHFRMHLMLAVDDLAKQRKGSEISTLFWEASDAALSWPLGDISLLSGLLNPLAKSSRSVCGQSTICEVFRRINLNIHCRRPFQEPGQGERADIER